jgi:hypothetical protein
MTDALPQNIRVLRYGPTPRGWAYPLKTSEIVDGLALGQIKRTASIHYNNVPERHDRFRKKSRRYFEEHRDDFDLLSIGGGLPQGIDGAYFRFLVRVCKPAFRQPLLATCRCDLFPIIRRWMASLESRSCGGALNLRYSPVEQGEIELVLSDQSDQQLFSGPVELDCSV